MGHYGVGGGGGYAGASGNQGGSGGSSNEKYQGASGGGSSIAIVRNSHPITWVSGSARVYGGII